MYFPSATFETWILMSPTKCAFLPLPGTMIGDYDDKDGQLLE